MSAVLFSWASTAKVRSLFAWTIQSSGEPRDSIEDSLTRLINHLSRFRDLTVHQTGLVLQGVVLTLSHDQDIDRHQQSFKGFADPDTFMADIPDAVVTYNKDIEVTARHCVSADV